MRHVPYVNLGAQFAQDREHILACVTEVFARGEFVGGEMVEGLEVALAEYFGVGHSVTLNSGTDALILAMKALGLGAGDEVITPPNSFVASTAAIVAVGATPVFADVRADLNIDPAAVAAAVTSRTKAIMPVHLAGRMADMNPIVEIAKHHRLFVIEDAAQAMGSRYEDRLAGAIGHLGCFSTHPLKNFNAAGDGGFVTTSDAELAMRIRRLRNHGLVDRDTVAEWGTVSRMDALQAAILTQRLPHLDSVITRRRENAERYRAHLDPAHVFFAPPRGPEFHTFHTFVVEVDRREGLQTYLADRGIGTAVHYPVPIHLQPAARDLGYARGDFPLAERQATRVLSLPIHQSLSAADIDYVVASINGYYGR